MSRRYSLLGPQWIGAILVRSRLALLEADLIDEIEDAENRHQQDKAPPAGFAPIVPAFGLERHRGIARAEPCNAGPAARRTEDRDRLTLENRE